MNSSEFVDNSDGETSEKERVALCRVKTESEDPVSGAESVSPGRILGSSTDGAGKRTAAQNPPDGPNATLDQNTSTKRMKVSTEVLRTREHTAERVGKHMARPRPSGLASPAESKDAPAERTIASYRKPLYSISHRITEKKAASGVDQHTLQEPGGGRLGYSGLLLPKLGGGEPGRHEHSPATATASAATTAETDSTLYPLIEKMFFILNTLNSSMTQLHSKVDLLSLEVTRIKRRIDPPSEKVAEFQPPPEYRLTAEELGQLAEQTSSAGELGCRLLVQLFPELFAPAYGIGGGGGGGGCSTCGASGGRRTPDSLHLQLVRNYVEACFPLVRNGDAWQAECLPQINDFFSRFWAQKDMESAGRRAPVGLGFEPPEPNQTRACHYIDEDGRDEASLSPESRGDNLNNGVGGSNGNLLSDLVFDAQEVGEDLDDLSSPGDFAVFLMHRLFPEVFDEGKMPEGYSCYGGGSGGMGKLVLDSDRLEIIRKYMEANFPDVPEDSWLQLCVQRMEEVMESAQGDGDGSEPEIARGDESYDSASLPDDVSVVKIGGDFRDYERTSQACKQAKKSSLVPIDFDKVEIPLPDFDVPPEFLLSREQLKVNYECSLSIGNFASRLLVLMFPELFTYENARKNYNCSGSLGKKQLDPVRVNLIRHYVQLLYPRAKNDRVWTLEFVGKLDERCRRRDTEQRRSYQQQRKVYAPEPAPMDFTGAAGQASGQVLLAVERFKDDFEIPPLPPEKSNKDFCKIPLEELTVTAPEFPVPSAYLLSDAEVREIVQQSLSVGNFAARLLVRLFPELFTQENLRLQYNHSGACNKKQLDPLRLRLIRHYVEAVYPVDKMEEVWHYECVPSIDERCRRPNRKKCDILKKAKRSSTVSYL